MALMAVMDEQAANVDGAQSLFNSGVWFELLHSHCSDDAIRFDIQAIVGSTQCTLPLWQSPEGNLAALANWYSFRWQPQLAGNKGQDRALALTKAFRKARTSASVLKLYPITTEDDNKTRVIYALQKAGWLPFSTVITRNHWLEIGKQSFADWWSTRPGQLRSTVKRKSKSSPLKISVTNEFAEQAWLDFCELYAARWSAGESHPAFLEALARYHGQHGTLRLGIARLEGRLIAAQFWTVNGAVANIHKLAQDTKFPNLSAGTLLTFELFRHAIEIDKVRRIDFGTGTEAFKLDWTNQHADLIEILAVDPRRLAGWRAAIRGNMKRLVARVQPR